MTNIPIMLECLIKSEWGRCLVSQESPCASAIRAIMTVKVLEQRQNVTHQKKRDFLIGLCACTEGANASAHLKLYKRKCNLNNIMAIVVEFFFFRRRLHCIAVIFMRDFFAGINFMLFLMYWCSLDNDGILRFSIIYRALLRGSCFWAGLINCLLLLRKLIEIDDTQNYVQLDLTSMSKPKLKYSTKPLQYAGWHNCVT